MSCEQKLGVNELGKALIADQASYVYTLKSQAAKRTLATLHASAGCYFRRAARLIHKEFVSNFLFAMVWAKRLPSAPRKSG